MFDWIPLPIYNEVYFYVLLIIVLIVFLQSQTIKLENTHYLNFINNLGLFFFIFIIFFLGTRPISGQYFGDMGTYNRIYTNYQKGIEIKTTKDLFFQYFMVYCGKVFTVKQFFFICSAIYVIPHYVISKKWFKDYWFFAFLMMVGSFSFWAYGTNGIRNGMATAVFLLAFTSKKKVFQIFWLLVSVNFHASMYLPALGFVITWFYNKPKGFYYFWLASIPLSLGLPGFWENFFATLVEDDRSVYLTSDEYDAAITKTGFRWDFLIYSALGVGAGAYYLFKKKIEDQQYIQLYNTFLFTNAFWILVIRANFSNRFAYLSWFLMGLVIIYPWVKYDFEKNQHFRLGAIILIYYMFTYLMNIILK